MMNDDKMIQVSYSWAGDYNVFLFINPKDDNSLVLRVRGMSTQDIVNPTEFEFKKLIDDICCNDIGKLVNFANYWLVNFYSQCWWDYDRVARVRNAVLLLTKNKDRAYIETLMLNKFILPEIKDLNYDDLVTYLYEFTEGLHQSAKTSEIFNNDKLVLDCLRD